MKTVRDFDFTGQSVLLRADLDEPITDGTVADDFRLRHAVPTIRHVATQSDKVRIIGHLDRPGGEPDQECSLAPVVSYLEEQLERDIPLVTDYDAVPEEDIVVLENLRFHPGERENTTAFTQRLAQLADLYVNEAFAVSHRRHASICGVPKHLPGGVGFQFEQEIQHLTLDNATEPVVALLGGAKLGTKMPVVKHLLSQVDTLLLGGAMIFTFYKANGWSVGDSLVDDDFLLDAKTLLGNDKLVLPHDVVTAPSPTDDGTVVDADAIPDDMQGLDIGPATINAFKNELERANTVIWNGPLGYDEVPEYRRGTEAIAEYLASHTGKTVVGGGDTARVLDELGLADAYTHVSTGGGAALTVLEGQTLPGLEALED